MISGGAWSVHPSLRGAALLKTPPGVQGELYIRSVIAMEIRRDELVSDALQRLVMLLDSVTAEPVKAECN